MTMQEKRDLSTDNTESTKEGKHARYENINNAVISFLEVSGIRDMEQISAHLKQLGYDRFEVGARVVALANKGLLKRCKNHGITSYKLNINKSSKSVLVEKSNVVEKENKVKQTLPSAVSTTISPKPKKQVKKFPHEEFPSFFFAEKTSSSLENAPVTQPRVIIPSFEIGLACSIWSVLSDRKAYSLKEIFLLLSDVNFNNSSVENKLYEMIKNGVITATKNEKGHNFFQLAENAVYPKEKPYIPKRLHGELKDKKEASVTNVGTGSIPAKKKITAVPKSNISIPETQDSVVSSETKQDLSTHDSVGNKPPIFEATYYIRGQAISVTEMKELYKLVSRLLMAYKTITLPSEAEILLKYRSLTLNQDDIEDIYDALNRNNCNS